MKRLIFTLLFALNLTNFTQAQVISEFFYNDPGGGQDLHEFIEIHNNTGAAIDMTGYTMTGVNFNFPSISLDAGGYFVIAVDSMRLQNAFPGLTAYQWESGALSNGGETIAINDASGNIVDQLTYDNAAPWNLMPNGSGNSFVLCDVNADNADPANWLPAVGPTSYMIGNNAIFANPGEAGFCPGGAFVSFYQAAGAEVIENVGTMTIGVVLANPGMDDVTVDAQISFASTASPSDYVYTDPTTITFPAGTDTLQFISIEIVDDMEVEGIDTIIINLSNPSMGTGITNGKYTISINDNDSDTPLTNDLILTGVIDGPLSGGLPKALEFYVVNDIADLSTFGVSRTNADDVDYNFPAVSATAEDYIYLTRDSAGFHDYFGFAADFITTSNAANGNGDDAYLLFEQLSQIDAFGEANMDGTGTPWEYQDSWAYRKDGTGPDGDVFVVDNWLFGTPNILDGSSTNADATSPFPIGTYSPIAPTEITANDDDLAADYNATTTLNVLANDVIPGDVTSLTIITNPTAGIAMANGIMDISYTPEQDACGIDSLVYEVCNAGGCDQATVLISIECPPSYPLYDIALVTADGDGDLQADSVGTTCELRGVVYGPNYRPSGLTFVLIDGNNDGITVFSFTGVDGYMVNEGDEISVKGSITQFRGLIQIMPDEISVISTDNSLVDPTVVTALGENTESQLVRANNLMVMSVDGDNYTVVDGDGNTMVLRLDSDIPVTGADLPTSFDAIGLGSQFSSAGDVVDDGYQFLPRYIEDILMADAVLDPSLAEDIKYYPNPTSKELVIETEESMDFIVISNVLGQTMKVFKQADLTTRVDVSNFANGVYIISFLNNDRTWSTEFVKK